MTALTHTCWFPVLRDEPSEDAPSHIPWGMAEEAYAVYSRRYGSEQSLERIAERGGFGPGELDMFIPGWRERVPT